VEELIGLSSKMQSLNLYHRNLVAYSLY